MNGATLDAVASSRRRPNATRTRISGASHIRFNPYSDWKSSPTVWKMVISDRISFMTVTSRLLLDSEVFEDQRVQSTAEKRIQRIRGTGHHWLAAQVERCVQDDRNARRFTKSV